jgi:hypothetical protein
MLKLVGIRPRPVDSQETNGGFMRFFHALHEAFRDHARDNISAGLAHLDIKARMAERSRKEVKIGGSGSVGLIEIYDGPIR